MTSDAKYRLLVDDYETSNYLRVSFSTFAALTVVLPFAAFVFCILYSIIYYFEQSTATQCHAYNVLPSVSAAIGGYSPQREVWKIAIITAAIPRCVFIYLFKNYNKLVLSRNIRCLLVSEVVLHIVENVSLISLSIFDSSNFYPIHEKSFIVFVITSEMHMLLVVVMHQRFRQHARTNQEARGLKWKKIMVAVNITAILLATYYFVLHSTWCPNFAYTKFALCEYVVVLSNMVFHVTAILDFYGKDLVVHRYGVDLVTNY